MLVDSDSIMALSFDSLPEEVQRCIISYADIPSLAALSMTHKALNENISSLASDDVTWYALIQGRFGIGCNHRRVGSRTKKKQRKNVVIVSRSLSSSLSLDGMTKSTTGKGGRKRRPTTYGGVTWKDAYRSLASTMRIPETSITSGSQVSGGGGAIFASPRLRGRNAKKSVADFFGVWCMVTHAENCRTKTIGEGGSGRRRRRNHHEVAVRDQHNVTLPYRTNRRYIELKVCLQNTRSSQDRIVVPDMSAIRIASVDEADYFASWGWDKWDDGYESTFEVLEVGPWRPKMILRHRFGSDDTANQHDEVAVDEWNARIGKRDIVLRSFEVVILSIHISCPESFVYETDVLSSMWLISVPIVADGWPVNANEDAKDKGNFKSIDVSIARFLEEDALWEYYTQLPGGCLSLTDRSRLVPV